MSASAQPSPASRSFAGLLAELASPEKKFPPARDLDGLADDIATLSYESALKTHTRYRAADPPEPAASPFAPSAGRLTTAAPEHAQERVTPSLVPPTRRKCASITVRLTRDEDEQLRKRSAEAGLTISAYLRSCAFEVESLRAQVKQTLAELRQPEAPTPQRKGHLKRLFAWRKNAS